MPQKITYCNRCKYRRLHTDGTCDECYPPEHGTPITDTETLDIFGARLSGEDRAPYVGGSATALRDDGIARSAEHAPDEWKAAALEAVRRACCAHPSFIVDAVWEFCEKPREARAMGAVMLQAVRRGWCVGTNEYRNGEQPKSHANPRRVWRSLLYGTGRAAA